MRKLLISAAILAAHLASASDVTGTVRLADGRPASQAIVILRGETRSKPMAHAAVDQRDRKFIPHVSVVTVGTKVDFPNNDTIFHNVFTEYHSTKFDFGMYPRGQTKHQVFDRPGLAVLMCGVHPDMSAYIMVVDTPFYAVADSSGHFRIADVPGGKYELQVWHESGQKAERTVSIERSSSLDLSLKK